MSVCAGGHDRGELVGPCFRAQVRSHMEGPLACLFMRAGMTAERWSGLAFAPRCAPTWRGAVASLFVRAGMTAER